MANVDRDRQPSGATRARARSSIGFQRARRCGGALPGRSQCRPYARSSAATRYKLSLLPSGVVRPGKLSVIGNGVVVDPWALCSEIEKLRGQGV